jgi:hypothetical protein
MKTMSKTEALKTASRAVGAPMGRGSSWTFYGPYYSDRLDGPSAEHKASSYPAIVRRRSQCVVEIAVALMGIKGYVDIDSLSGGAREMLAQVLSDPKRYVIAH